MEKQKITGGIKENWSIYRQISKKIKIDKNEKILDAGCGEGLLSKELSNKIYGFDINPKSVKICKGKGYEEVKLGNIYKIPFKDKQFDTTFCLEVFQYLPNKEKAFEELIRVTKGRIVLSAPNSTCIGLRSLLFKRWRKEFLDSLNIYSFPFIKEHFEELAKKYHLKLKIHYASCRFIWLRNLFGSLLASEVIGEFTF